MPAPAIEQLVTTVLDRLLPAHDNPLDALSTVHVRGDSVALLLPRRLRGQLSGHLADGERIEAGDDGHCMLVLPLRLPLRGGRRSIEAGQPGLASPDPVLIAALRRAHAMTARDATGLPLVTAAPQSPYNRKILRLAFLAPDIQRDIIAGRQPAHLNLQAILHAEIPLDWGQQRQALGWSA